MVKFIGSHTISGSVPANVTTKRSVLQCMRGFKTRNSKIKQLEWWKNVHSYGRSRFASVLNLHFQLPLPLTLISNMDKISYISIISRDEAVNEVTNEWDDRVNKRANMIYVFQMSALRKLSKLILIERRWRSWAE